MPTVSKTSVELDVDRFSRLVRSTPKALDAYLGEVTASACLAETRATVHCRYILNDGNQRPRVCDFARRIAEELVDYAIPRSEIEKAHCLDESQSTTRHTLRLQKKALNLFTDLERTGEGGEMLLYLLTESQLGIPQIMCKMPLKTSSRMHYHGADGIHATIDPKSGNLALYWGESKLYKKLNDAVAECFKSLAPFLTSVDGSKAKPDRDLELIAGNTDLTDEALEAAIRDYVDRDHSSFRKLEYRGVALVGFDVDHYPTDPNETFSEEVLTALESEVDAWNAKIKKSIVKHALHSFQLEVFCLPFPSVEEFRAAFLSELGIRLPSNSA